MARARRARLWPPREVEAAKRWVEEPLAAAPDISDVTGRGLRNPIDRDLQQMREDVERQALENILIEE